MSLQALTSRPFPARDARDTDSTAAHRSARWGVPIGIALGVFLVVLAYRNARTSTGTEHYLIFWAGYLTGFGAITVAGLLSWSGRQVQRWALVALGLFTFIPKFLMSVNHPSFYDEWGHWRHVNDILATGSLTPSDPFQPIIRYFPGLGTTTAFVHEVTRLGTWHSGQVVIVAAHITALLAVFGIAEALNVGRRGAYLAAIIYAANPNFIYFDSQYGYESLALPLALTAIWLTLRAITPTNRHWPWIGGAVLAIVATTLTHHVSSIFLATMLVLIAAANIRRTPDRAMLTSLGLAGVGLAAPAVWLTTFARPTLRYLSPRLHTIVDQALQEVGLRSTPHVASAATGMTTGPTSRSLFAGGGPPRFEELAAIAAPLLVGLVVLVAVVKLWQSRRSRSVLPALPFLLLAATYFAILPLSFLASAAEVVHRSWAFSYVGIAVMAGVAFGDPPLLTPTRPGRLATLIRTAASAPAVAVVILVAVVGNIPAGTNVQYRFPGPYQFSSDSWGVDAASISLAKWVNTNLPRSSGVVTDRVTGEVLTGYSTARVPSLYQGAAFGLFQNPDNPSDQLRAVLKSGNFTYFILDSHIFTVPPVHGWFQTYRGISSVNVAALQTIKSTPFIHRVRTFGPYEIYQINP